MTDDWKTYITSLHSRAAFHAAAAADDLQRTESGLRVALPRDLRALLAQSDGVAGRYGEGLVWPSAQILKVNLEFRSSPSFRDLYMPFDALLFFADAGNGDQFAYRILNGRATEHDIYLWDHENDSRSWKASTLRQYLEWLSTGRMQV